MGKSIRQLNQYLNFEFLSLDIEGTNIEKFYLSKYEVFRFNNSGLTPKEKIEILFSGQLAGKSEITIQTDLSENTFIHDELVRSDLFLKEPIRPVIREKLNIWVKYLNKKNKKEYIEKADRSFPQFLKNIADDKKEAFAYMLRDEFCTRKGKQIRYMFEGLKQLSVLSFSEGEMSELFRSTKKHFNRDIGTYNGIFNPDPEKPNQNINKQIWKDHIDSAIDRINLILEQFPPK